MPNNFFKYNLPYGIEKNSDGQWMAFNRDYLPLGYIDPFRNHDRTTKNEISNLPIFSSYKGLTEKKLISLAFCPVKGIRRNDKTNEIEMVYLYEDGNENPAMKNTKKNWDNYFERLKKLSLLGRKD